MENLEFELAYLSLLTRQGLKPLSRWEKPFGGETPGALQKLGLKTRVVERSVQTGKRLTELLFSTSAQCLDVYAGRFGDRPVDHSRETVRLEGLLFGYPTCCVESYVARGYARNSLRRRDQRILFHWACPHCAITPLLMPQYRRIYRACRAARRRGAWRAIPKLPDTSATARLRRRVAIAAALVALGIMPSTMFPVAADPLDPHVLALSLNQDPDRDFLTSPEEVILGLDPALFDEDINAVPDGVDLAQQLSAAIDALPTAPSVTNAYVTHHLAFGMETCQVCSAPVNMGFLEVGHPLENQTLAIPYVAKHSLEHGSFSYSGSLHAGRINPPLLKFLLASPGQGHFISEPAGTDADRDGLRDWEEPAFGTDPQKPDTDGDQLLDGIDTARALRGTLNTLPSVNRPEDGPRDRPFVVKQTMDGDETCPRCGETWPMALWQVTNPVTGDSITIPSMALHQMEHGAFGWHGGQLLGGQGRVDPRQLQAVLTGRPNQHLLPVTPDADSDLLANQEELDLGRAPANPDEDANSVRDGLDLARATACAIAALPTKPSLNQVYRLDFLLRGLERCEICGKSVNMGHLTVCNPLAQLYAKVPYIALHYLEHDSFSFAGDVHGKGRADVKLVLNALHATGSNHLLPVSGDTDADGLKDNEETYFGTDPNVADTNHDGVPDGFALALEMHERIKALPTGPQAAGIYLLHHEADCVAPCPVCGQTFNCGYVEIINAWAGLSLPISYMNLHFLERGSFAASPAERVDPLRLEGILRPAVLIAVAETRVTLRWMTRTGLIYQILTAPEVTGPWAAGQVFVGDGTEFTFTEDQAAGAPRRFYRIIATQPDGPTTTSKHRGQLLPVQTIKPTTKQTSV